MSAIAVERTTKETSIKLELVLDGRGSHDIRTTISFFDHMLSQLAQHGYFDLSLEAKGDTHVDFHHTVEDCGIALGQAFARAVGDKKGIVRYGHAVVPMNESLASVTVDFSGRPYFVLHNEMPRGKTGDFDTELVEEFLQAFANSAAITLHVRIERGGNLHHMAEAVFKALGRALDAATRPEPRAKGVPSTKGTL